MSFLPEDIPLESIPVVAHITNRIYQVLPFQSGLSLDDVEDDFIFLSARNALITIAEADKFDDIVQYSILILEKLNEIDSYLILKQRTANSLSSILIILRLLADLTKINWDSREPPQRKQSIESDFSNHSISSANAVGFSSTTVDHHSVQPTKLDSQIAVKAVALLSRLKSTNSLTLELALINGTTVSQQNLYEDISTKHLIDQIDVNVETIIRFLAASNPVDFFNFIASKLAVLKHNIANDSEYAPFLELFASIYLNEDLLYEYLKYIKLVFSSIKKAAYRQLVLSFFLKAIRVWVHARPYEFLNSSKPESNASIEAETLFDELLAIPESTVSRNQGAQNQRQFKASYRFLAFLLTLSSKSIEQYLSGEFKSKTTALKKLTTFNVNKKHKVLSNIIKTLEQSTSKDSSENISVLESLGFMVLLANVASSIFRFDQKNVIVEFTLRHADIVTKALVPISSSKSSPLLYKPSVTETQLLNDFRLAYFSSFCVLKSKDFIQQLVQILNDESASLETLNITCSILRVFSVTPSLNNSNQALIISILPALRKLIIRLGLTVKLTSYTGGDADAETSSLNKTNSSTSSDFYGQNRHSGTPDITRTLTITNSDTGRSTSTPSSIASLSTPKSEKFRENTRSLFRHHHSSTHSSIPPQQHDDIRSVESRDSQKNSILSRDILTNAFAIFKKHPHLLLSSFSNENVNDRVKWINENAEELLEPLSVALNDHDPKLLASAKDFLHSFYNTATILDDLESVVCAFEGTSAVAYSLAKLIETQYSSDTSDSKKRDTFEYFIKILNYRIKIHTILANHVYFEEVKVAAAPYHSRVFTMVGEILLFSLCTTDRETYSLIKRGFKAHYAELKISAKVLNSREVDYNREFFDSVIGDTTLTTGAVALQKNIRKHFLKLTKPTAALINTWNRVYEKWFTLVKSDFSELSQTSLIEFRNFAGFLAATSGIFVQIGTPTYISDVFSDKVDNFINEQLLLLSDSSLVTRENAKEILASETNPNSYKRLVDHLKPIIDSLYKRAGKLTPTDYIVAEHLIVILKAILDNGDQFIIYAISTDIVDGADLLAKTIDSSKQVDLVVLKLRIRISLLFHKLEVHGDKLLHKYAFKTRNRFLRYVYGWFDQAVTYNTESEENEHHHDSKSHHLTIANREIDYVYMDIVLESAKALSLLLESLVLEAPQVLSEKELKFSKARIFSIYFNTFLKALTRYSEADKFPVSVKHKVSLISGYIVTCLTNLLKSNVDVGLSYALPIGYYTNLSIRVSFLKVFVRIVESYSNYEEFASMAAKKKVAAELFKKIIHNPRFLISIGRACPPVDAPALAACAQSLANGFNQSAIMVSHLVEEEIMYGNSYTDILRRNSFASRSLSAFGRAKGSDYLISTLRPILTEIRDSEADLEVEKIELGDPDAEQNLNNFIHYLRKLVNIIINSLDNFPMEFRKVCHSISKTVKLKFPAYRLIAVGSFIFLRFFCPAIVSPESEKLVDIPNRQTQRKFLLLAKVLQNMANGSITTLRWPLLKAREPELLELNDKITDFLENVTYFDESYTFEPNNDFEMDDSDYSFLHSFVYDNWDTTRIEYLRGIDSMEEIKHARRISIGTMEYLRVAGQPTTNFGYQIPSSISPENNSELYEFMSNFSNRELGSVLESAFVRQDISQDGTHILVFSYSDYLKIKNIDEDIALYRFFQVASKVWDSKFIFVLDCTGNDGSFSLPTRALTLMAKLVPIQMRLNCLGLHYYNVSSGFFKVFNENLKNPNLFMNLPEFRLYFHSGFDDKKTVMDLALSRESTRCYSDVRVKFNDASIYQPNQKRFVPITLKIGHQYIQVCQTTPQRLKMKGELKEIYLYDVYHLDDIDTVQATETTSVPDEITISFKNGTNVVLTTPKYLEIMRLLYFTESRVLSAPTDVLFKERAEKSVSDLLGQLFNVIFLGLTSSSSEVRSISYNILAATQKNFNLNIDRELVQFHEAYFPRDNNSFVVSISEKLARSCPGITFEFISAFFKVYSDSITPRQRLSAILYVAPWISNVYDHVFKLDDEHGPDYVAEVIRNFLSVSTIDTVFISAFNSCIWSKLCLEERITPILVNEIVLSAVDREAEGSDWRSIISFLTSTPTVELCSAVIKRLRDIAHIPFPDHKGLYSIAAHSNWIEITVLVQVGVSLFFDNLVFAELFLPDVFYIVTVLVDVGPLDLRVASHQLLLNLLQSFLTKPTISPASREVIFDTVKQFTSHRSRLLFGLNRDNADSFPTELSKFSTRISTMESLVSSLLEIIQLASTNSEEREIWIAKWNRYVIDAAVRKDSVLRGRALLLLGVLSRSGINDNMVVKILEMVAEDSIEDIQNPRYLYLAICTIFSLSRISEGLLVESQLFSKLFWLAVVITHSDHIALYQGGLQFMTKVLETMNVKEKFINNDVISGVLKDKKVFGPLLKKVEEFDSLVIERDNFDQVLIHFASKGLQLPYTKSSSIDAFKTFFQLRYINELQRISQFPESNFEDGTIGHLLFLYILLKPSELRTVLDEIDLIEENVTNDEQSFIPKVLANFVMSDTPNSNAALIQVSIYFNEGNPSEKSRLNFLQILKYIGQRNPNILQKIYYEIRDTLRKVVGSTTLPNETVTEMFNVASLAFVSDGYDNTEVHLDRTNKLLSDMKISGVRKYKFPASNGSIADPSATAKSNRAAIIQPIIRRVYESRLETA